MIQKGFGQLSATIVLKSGLHIGTGEKNIERGESLPVMMNPRNQMPYIPGSSLKGKMRHMLELAYGRASTMHAGSPCCCGKCSVCLLFGSGSTGTTYEPTRLLFRDSFPTEATETLLEKIDLEEKPGVSIDRETGKAAKGALFPMKRVPEGSEFKMQVSARIFEKDKPESVRKWIAMGLYLMEQDALGGGGTRGSGHIAFEQIVYDGEPFDTDWREQCGKDRDTLQTITIK